MLTNALVVDYSGIYKADVGLMDGRILKISKAGILIRNQMLILLLAGTEIIAAGVKS